MPKKESNGDKSPSDWAELTRNDLDSIYRTLTENHPGPVDTENSWFSEHLSTGFEPAKQNAAKAKNYDDYEAVLALYVNGFNDGHLGVRFNAQRRDIPWTGFLIAKRGSEYVVAESEDKAPKVGWTLQSCDGITAMEIMTNYVLPLKRGSPASQADLFRRAPWILQGNSNLWRPKFSTCVFDSGGKSINFALKYRNIDESELSTRINAVNKDSTRKFSIENLDKKTIWVNLPSFHPEQDQVKDLQDLIADMHDHRNARYVVFDVRGNTGGSSVWGRDVLVSLYGEGFSELLNRNDAIDASYAEWRVSPGNLAYLEKILPMFKERHGEMSDGYKEFDQTLKSMREATKAGKTFARQGGNETMTQTTSTKSSPKLLPSAKAILLTDGYCGSACLDFMDMALLLPNVVHVGGSTGADTLYMDIRSEKLPSGLAELSFAQKVYRKRRRGHNIGYDPSTVWLGSFSDTSRIKEWVKREVIPKLGN